MCLSLVNSQVPQNKESCAYSRNSTTLEQAWYSKYDWFCFYSTRFNPGIYLAVLFYQPGKKNANIGTGPGGVGQRHFLGKR